MIAKRIVCILMAVLLLIGLSACGDADAPKTPDNPAAAEPAEAAKPAETAEPAVTVETPEVEEPEAESPASDDQEEPEEPAAPKEPVKFVFGSPMPFYTELFNLLKEPLAEQGVELEIEELPMPQSGYSYLQLEDIDMCVGLMEADYAAAACYTFVTPYNVYSGKFSSLDEFKAADKRSDTVVTTIAHTYSPRIQTILDAAGIIELENGPANPLKETEYQMMVSYLYQDREREFAAHPDDFAAIVSAPSAAVEGLNLLMEDPTLDDPEGWGYLVVRKADLEDPEKVAVIDLVVKAFQSQITIDYLAQSGEPSHTAGWDVDLLAAYK